MELVLGYLFIFAARCTDVSMATIRTIMVVRGQKLVAAAIGFVEIIIYVFAINKVLSGMDNLGNLMSYALGFATGNYIGIMIEEKMALGMIIAQVVTKKDAKEFADFLRTHDFGVTTSDGEGREGKLCILKIVLERKKLLKLQNCVYEYDKDAFTTVSDVRNIKGGYVTRSRGIKRK